MMSSYLPKLRLPAEFEKHKATWMIWPSRIDTWHHNVKPARMAYAEVANAVSQFEQVNMIIKPEDQEYATSLLDPSVKFFHFPFDSEWTRDTGPLFVKDENVRTHGIDFSFDSWGEIYPDYELDDELASVITKHLELPLIKNELVLEGGAVLVDGEGTLIATEECFFNKKRKGEESKSEIEKIFHELFGIEKTIWIKRGLYKDIVNGHIDNLCSFIRPGVLALAWTENTDDPQYEISREALEILISSKDARGRSFEIVKIHQPDPVFITKEECNVVGEAFYEEGDRLGASYVNFYITNGGIILPSFDDDIYDTQAFEKVKELFTDRKVIQIPSREIILGGGGIHCITMQEPA